MPQRIRGSLVDTVTLEEVFFEYEPKMKTKDVAKYGAQAVIGQRLQSATWVGSGECSVDIAAYAQGVVSGGYYNSADNLIAAFKAFTVPQPDTRAPHPVYINMGSTYVGKQYILIELDVDYLVFEYPDTLGTTDAKIKLKLEEIPIDNGSGVIG